MVNTTATSGSQPKERRMHGIRRSVVPVADAGLVLVLAAKAAASVTAKMAR